MPDATGYTSRSICPKAQRVAQIQTHSWVSYRPTFPAFVTPRDDYQVVLTAVIGCEIRERVIARYKTIRGAERRMLVVLNQNLNCQGLPSLDELPECGK